MTEQTFQPARPGEPAAVYVPISNRIVRRPGQDFKIFRACRRRVLHRWKLRFLRSGLTDGLLEFLDAAWMDWNWRMACAGAATAARVS